MKNRIEVNNMKRNVNLRDYQARAVSEVLTGVNGLGLNDRATLVMACGTGKTKTALEIINNYIDGLGGQGITLLLFPSLYLINQTYVDYKELMGESFSPLVVCSDSGIVENSDDDIFEIDLSEVNYPVTTDVVEIQKYLGDERIINKTIFVTYHSSYQVGVALKELGLYADLGVFDEAHKTAIKNNGKEDSYGCGLRDDCIPMRKRLFMTATPKHYKFKADGEYDDIEDVEDDIAFSMDNEELYGKIAYEYDMRSAINDGWIADYKVLGILIDNGYIERFRRFKGVDKDSVAYNNLEIEMKAVKAKAIEQTMKKFGIKRALAFHRNIADSVEFAKLSNDDSYSNLKISHIDGKTSHKDREEIIRKLRSNENYIVSNSRLLTEGVDVPSIDMVAILKNMGSKVDMVQTVGRVQRFERDRFDNCINPDKVGYVLLPIFVSDMDMSEEEIKKNQELNILYNVVNSMRENDGQLRNELLLKRESKKVLDENLNDKLEDLEDKAVVDDVVINTDSLNVHLEIGHISSISEFYQDDNDGIDLRFKEALDKFTDKVEGVVLGGRIITQEDWINATLDFIGKFGYESLKKITKHTYNGVEYNIGSWRNSRRQEFKNLKTQIERSAMIEEFSCIHEDYLFDSGDVSKRNNINATLDFIEKYGYENLKKITKHTYNGVEYNIGSWRKERKRDFKKLKTQIERSAMIEEFSCIHEDYLFDDHDVSKRNYINATLDFIGKFGYEGLKQPTKHTYNGVEYAIGAWRNSRRQEFKNLKSDIEREEMVKEFECIHEDYLFDGNEVSKRNHINATLDFIGKFGYESLKTDTKHIFNGVSYNIGSWRNSRRKDFKKLKSPQDKLQMIEEFSELPLDYLGNEAVEFAREQGLGV